MKKFLSMVLLVAGLIAASSASQARTRTVNVVCANVGHEYKTYCYVDENVEKVELIRRLEDTECKWFEWGESSDGVWVMNGCIGIFRVTIKKRGVMKYRWGYTHIDRKGECESCELSCDAKCDASTVNKKKSCKIKGTWDDHRVYICSLKEVYD